MKQCEKKTGTKLGGPGWSFLKWKVMACVSRIEKCLLGWSFV